MKSETHVLPLGFNTRGYNLTDRESYLDRDLITLDNKTISIIKYHFQDYEAKNNLIKEDYNQLRHVGPKEISEGCWLLDADSKIIITAPHSAGPRSDKGVSELALRLHQEAGVNALIGTISRQLIDYNRQVSEGEKFYEDIDSLIQKGAKTLIDLHSMRRKDEYDIELGTLYGGSAPKKLIAQFKEKLEEHGYRTVIDRKWIGGNIVYTFMKSIDCIQVEISNKLINEDKLLKSLTEIIQQIDS